MAPYVPKIRSTYTATSHSTLDGLRQRECLAYIQTSVLSAAPLPAFSPKPPPSFLLPPASVLPVIPIPSFGMILSLRGRCPTFLGVTECGGFCGEEKSPGKTTCDDRRDDRRNTFESFWPTSVIPLPVSSSDLGICFRPISRKCFALTPTVHRCRAIVRRAHTNSPPGPVADPSAMSCHCE